jgi:para-aminobenzoate synthetase component 1
MEWIIHHLFARYFSPVGWLFPLKYYLEVSPKPSYFAENGGQKMTVAYKKRQLQEDKIKQELMAFLSGRDAFFMLDSHVESNPSYFEQPFAYHRFRWVMATGISRAVTDEKHFPQNWSELLHESKGQWSFGFLGYDLKNRLEDLPQHAPVFLNLPDLFWYIPQLVIACTEEEIIVWENDVSDERVTQIEAILSGEKITDAPEARPQQEIHLQQRVSREKYIHAVQKLKEHIQRGDIYEVNYCMEFFAENVMPHAMQIWKKLSAASPMPFSAYIDMPDFCVFSASPERFLRRENNTLTAQPMKGTIRRGATLEEDKELIAQLKNDPKERSENVMIVDLVRNDLAHTAEKGSVQVEDLFGVQTFPRVHQMVSTIKSELREDANIADAVASAFPMGSMTGAPKIRAMELIDAYELSARNVYSGSIGYMDPSGNMDMNVVIRSLLYNKKTKYLSLSVGSAITINCDPEKEYEECMLKIAPLLQALGTPVNE